MQKEDRLGPLLGSAALFLVAAAMLTRWWVSGGKAAVGSNNFFHLVLLAGALVWLISAACGPTWTLRVTGSALPLGLFVVAGIVSVVVASYKLPAMETALAFFTYAVLFLLVLNLFGPERRHLIYTILFASVFTISVYSILQRVWLFDYVRSLPDAQALRQSGEFEARLLSNEVFGTFLYPNSLAGFLALTLPILAGSLADSRKDRTLLAFKGAGLLAGLVALLLTGSKGGWVAALVGGIALAGLALTRGLPRARRGFVIAGLALGAVLAGLTIAGPLSPAKLGKRSRSMEIRDVYWSAAVKMAKDKPVFGVGLDNFREHYWQYKSETQQETTKVHNDYLQVLVELGAPGLLLLVAFLGMTVRASLAPSVALEPVAVVPWERLILCSAATVSILLGYSFEGVFNDINRTPLLGMIVLGIWIGYVFLTHPREVAAAGAPQDFTRMGAASGFAALLVHLAVDFDLYEYGVAMALFFVAALVAALEGRLRTFEFGRASAAVAAVVMALIVIPLLAIVSPRVLGSESDKEAGLAALRQGVDLDARARGLAQAGRGPEMQDALARAKTSFDLAEKHLDRARQANPFDADVYLHYSSLNEYLWQRMRERFAWTRENVDQIFIFQELSLMPLRDGSAVRPRNGDFDFRLGLLHRRYAAFYVQAADEIGHQRSDYLVRAYEQRHEAIRHLKRAVDLYPTRSIAHYWLARAMDDAGDGDAPRHYAEALRLSELARREKLDRLELGPIEKARVFVRTDRTGEAKELLRNYFMTEVLRPGAKGEIRDPMAQRLAFEELRPRLAQMMPNDYDALLKPVIDGVIDDILASLPKP